MGGCHSHSQRPRDGAPILPSPPKTGHSCCDEAEVGGVSAPAPGKAQRGGAAGKLGNGRNDLSPLLPCPASLLAGFADASLKEGWRGVRSERPQRPRGRMASVATPRQAVGPTDRGATPGCPARRAQPRPLWPAALARGAHRFLLRLGGGGGALAPGSCPCRWTCWQVADRQVGRAGA